MSRTKRRTKWLPVGIIEDIVAIDPENPQSFHVSVYKTKTEQIAAIRKWQQDKRNYFCFYPIPKLYKTVRKHGYRQRAKQQICRWKRNPDFEVQPETDPEYDFRYFF